MVQGVFSWQCCVFKCGWQLVFVFVELDGGVGGVSGVWAGGVVVHKHHSGGKEG